MKAEKGALRVVFGCGGNRDRTKRPKMGNIAYTLADVVYVTSDNPRMEEPEEIMADILSGIPSMDKVKTEVLRPNAIAMAIAEASVHDVIVIAGKGHETYQEIRGIRYDMSDSEIAQEALRHYNQPQEAP
jgi:UDP-N-acetylmuramoyl-L-alanyl-D-glutamate--2,6-diaminopimelate ligase